MREKEGPRSAQLFSCFSSGDEGNTRQKDPFHFDLVGKDQRLLLSQLADDRDSRRSGGMGGRPQA